MSDGRAKDRREKRGVERWRGNRRTAKSVEEVLRVVESDLGYGGRQKLKMQACGQGVCCYPYSVKPIIPYDTSRPNI